MLPSFASFLPGVRRTSPSFFVQRTDLGMLAADANILRLKQVKLTEMADGDLEGVAVRIAEIG